MTIKAIKATEMFEWASSHVVCVESGDDNSCLYVRDANTPILPKNPGNHGILVTYLTQHPCPISLSHE